MCFCVQYSTLPSSSYERYITSQKFGHTYSKVQGILQRYDLQSGLRLVGLLFVFQQDNGPTHLQAV
jgi:hypothetical protein